MAEAGLFIGWGQVVRGREERALEVFNETIAMYGRFQGEGRIEDFEVALLLPHGGDLAGFVLLRGSEDQMEAVRRDEEFDRTMQKADLIVDGLGIIPTLVGEGIGPSMETYREAIAGVA